MAGSDARPQQDAPDFAALCKEAATPRDLHRLLAGRDPPGLTAREIALAGRAADRLDIVPRARVAFLGTHTVAPLPDYLRVHALGLGFGIDSWTAPYGQYMQELLGEDTELARFAPDVVFISCAMRQLAPRVHHEFALLTAAEIEAERERIIAHVVQAAEAAARRSAGVVLIGNFPRPAHVAFGVADGKRECGEAEFYLSLNLELIRQLRAAERVYVFDTDRIVGGLRPGSMDRMFFMAKSLWSDSACNGLAQELLRYVVAARGTARKCLVLDLDNTVWGGVVGEDGPAALEVGAGSPRGEAFEAFQYAIRSLRARGVILAACSKNNPADVDEAFATRDDMPLKRSDFSVAEIGWGDKAAGVRAVSHVLNIGEDSLVFLDDNPAERAIVRGALPEVLVPDLPRDPAAYATLLQSLVVFEKLRVGDDDLARLQDYGAQRERERLRTDAGSLDAFLAGLGTTIRIRRAAASDLVRVHELFNKTNQFNLTTRRYTLGDVQRFAAQPGYCLLVVTAQDSYGPMGTIGVCLLEDRGRAVHVDSFLMSCRALGRGIETATMNEVKRHVVNDLGAVEITAEFLPTVKNTPARDFLDGQGFGLIEASDGGVWRYRASGEALKPLPCAHVEVLLEDAGRENC